MSAQETISIYVQLGGAEGTVYIMGVYNSEATWPSSSSEVTISGYDETSQITCAASLGIYFKSDLVFENIEISLGQHAHFNSEGNKITFGEGFNMSSGMIHVGGLGGVTASEHIVIDGGCVFSKTASIGGAYNTGSAQSIDGDVTVISFDAVRTALELVRSGEINVDIECNPEQGPYIENVIRMLENGENIDKNYYVPEKIFTQENVGMYINDRSY